MSVRYIDIDSTYRNRVEWPSPAEFVVPISTSGRKPPSEALDPVCLSAPINTWYPFNFNRANPNKLFVRAKVDNSFSNGINSPTTFLIISENDTTSEFYSLFQQKENYYNGATCLVKDNSNPYYVQTTKILSYRYLGKYAQDFPGINIDRALLTVDYPIRILPEPYVAEQGGPPFTIPENKYIYIDIMDSTFLAFSDAVRIFVPCGRTEENAYPNYYITQGLSVHKILSYSLSTHTLDVDSYYSNNLNSIEERKCNISNNRGLDDYNYGSFNIRKEPPIFKKIDRIIDKTKIILTDKSVFENAYIWFMSISGENLEPNVHILRRITRVVNNIYDNTVSPPQYLGCGFEIDKPFDQENIFDTFVEIMPISYDNSVPLNYNGTLVQTDACYEVRISSLVLPNAILNVADGGNIAFYPSVYVEFGNNNNSYGLLNSNNPFCTKATFRLTVQDATNPLTRPFVVLSSEAQVMKFKPNEDIRFCVRMETGELFDTILKESYSPYEPNPYCQIRATITIRKL